MSHPPASGRAQGARGGPQADHKAGPADRAVLLTPGAGAGRDQPSLVAIEAALAPVVVERMDFPYRRAGRKSPDRAEVLVAAVREGAAALAERTGLAPDRLVLGGRSMGGRICSMAVAGGQGPSGPLSGGQGPSGPLSGGQRPAGPLSGGQGPSGPLSGGQGIQALGLVLVSYPLHPPGRPDRLRTEHLPGLDVPCLFVSGTRDAFGTRDELEAATAAIPGPVTHVWLEGGDHGLRRRDDEVAAIVRDWVLSVS